LITATTIVRRKEKSGYQADVGCAGADAAQNAKVTMFVGGAIIMVRGIAPVVFEVVVVVPVADIARFTIVVGAALPALAIHVAELQQVIIFAVVIDAALHAPAFADVADTTVAVVIDPALHAPALEDVAETTVAVVIDLAFHAPALVGVADRRIAIAIFIHLAHHASAIVLVADII